MLKSMASGKSLMQIICNGSKDMAEAVELLVKKGASVNTFDGNGLTPLMICAKEGHLRSINILVQAGADVNAKVKPTRTFESKASGYFNTWGKADQDNGLSLYVSVPQTYFMLRNGSLLV